MSRHYSCWPVSVARPVRSLFLSLLVRFTEGNVSALRHYGIPENERGREIRSWNRPDDIRTALSWINWNSFRGTDGGIGRPVRLIDSALWLLPDTHSRTAMLEWHGRIVSAHDLRKRFFRQTQILRKEASLFNFHISLSLYFTLAYYHGYSVLGVIRIIRITIIS